MYNIDTTTYEWNESNMSIAIMMICTDGICCVTDSRACDLDNNILSDEEIKSTVIRGLNGTDYIMCATGSGSLNGNPIYSEIEREFNYKVIPYIKESDEIVLYLANYIRNHKDDNLVTNVSIGYYADNKPHIVCLEISKQEIKVAFTDTKYAISGEPIARMKITRAVDNLLDKSVSNFANDCVDLFSQIIEEGKAIPNYTVGGYINVAAINNNGVMDL